MAERPGLKFLEKRHKCYLKRCLNVLPSSTSSYDTSRMTVLFFALSGLDILKELDEIDDSHKQEIIEWIYSLQVVPLDSAGSAAAGGFLGGPCLRMKDSVGTNNDKHNCIRKDNVAELNVGHIAMTYTALASLVILGDDLARVSREAVQRHIAALQCKDGSFLSTSGGSENDMRFVYCAAAVCHMLRDFSGFNMDSAVAYITSSINYDGGIGQGVMQESHGGSAYCALAALHLMGRLRHSLTQEQINRLILWLIRRQDGSDGGLQGRPNKPADTCYTFWVTASLKLLESSQLLEHDQLRQFVLATQDVITGGLAKYADSQPDGLHTFLGISGLALLGLDPSLRPVDPSLNITCRALEHLSSLY